MMAMYAGNKKFEELRDQLKQISYEELCNHGILRRANKIGCVCPDCGNGSGESGTGIEEFIQNGVVTSHCPKCGSSFDNIKILAAHFGLNDKTDFIEIVKRGAKELLNIDVENDNNTDSSDLDLKAIRELILKDIAESQKNLRDFVEKCGGKWRGLTFETLNFFHVGYLDKWTHPKNIVTGKNLFYSRRVIIPTGNNYIAIALNEDRQLIKKIFWKMSTGKELFGLDLLHKNIELLVIVEGEVDAMSIYQATGGKVLALATGGAGMKNFIADLANFFGKLKPRILILFDNDTTGKKDAPKLRDQLVENNFPTVFKFLAEGTEKCDANDILQRQGDDKLAEIVNNIIADSQADFESVEKQIEQYNTQSEFDCDFVMSDKMRRVIYFNGKTDSDNGKRLTALFSSTAKYIVDLDKWAFYDKVTGVWNVQTSGKNSLALFLADNAADIIKANATNPIEEKRAEPFKKHKYANPAISYFKSSDKVKINSRDFDKNQMLLPVANGVIDLSTGKLLEYAPNLFLTKQCPVEYKGLEYHSDEFNKFMEQILPDEQTRRAVLRYLGYCLTGNVSEEKTLFILGNGRNGKGTLMKILLTLLGDYATSFRIESLLQQKFKDGNSATPEFAKLDGCRLAYANEIPQGEKLDVAKFKDLTGGDKFSARKLHSEPVLIEPTHKFILCGQHLPEIFDANDIGYLERLIVVKFPQQFTGKNCNPKLKQELLAPDVLSGVLSTLVAECLAWQHEGLIISDAMTAEKQSYRDANNFIADFISEFCVIKANETCKRADILKKLRLNYSDDVKGLSDRALTDMFKNALPSTVEYQKSKFGKKFIGVGLVDEMQDNLQFDLQRSATPPPSTDFDTEAIDELMNNF